MNEKILLNITTNPPYIKELVEQKPKQNTLYIVKEKINSQDRYINSVMCATDISTKLRTLKQQKVSRRYAHS